MFTSTDFISDSLYVDGQNKKLYFIKRVSGLDLPEQLVRTNLDGTNLEIIIAEGRIPSGYVELAFAESEPGLEGWTIYLDQNQNGQRDPEERSTTTDADGNYSFVGLSPGTYFVREEQQAGWEQTAPINQTFELTITDDEVLVGIDFGNRASDNLPPEIAPVYDRTVEAGETLSFRIDNPGLEAGELLVGNQSTVAGQVLRIDPETGVQELIYQESFASGFAPSILMLDGDGTIWAPHRMIDPVDGSVQTTPFHRVLAQLPNGNYLVQQELDSGITEFNLTLGEIRSVTSDFPFGSAGSLHIHIAHDRRGEPFFDDNSNFYISGIDGLYSVNLVSGEIERIATLEAYDTHPAVIGVVALDERRLVLTSVGATVGEQARRAGWPHDGKVFLFDIETRDLQLIADGDLLIDPLDVAVSDDGIVYVADHNGMDPSGAGGPGSVVTIDLDTFEQRIVSNGQFFDEEMKDSLRSIFAVSCYDALGGCDLDDDPLTFSMEGLPQGAEFDVTTNTLTWTPSLTQGGTYEVNVIVTDGNGGFDSDRFTINVVGGIQDENRSPVFQSTPPNSATVASSLIYTAEALDPDGDPLTYDLPVHSAGMAVDPTSGTVVWTPTADQVGTRDIVLRVSDGRGGVDLQSFQITVELANTAPVITSRPTGPAIVDVHYHYQLQAQDADGDPITFELSAGPAGMSIDATSGLLTWTPTTSSVGSQHVAVSASDGRGATTTQSFDLPVVDSAVNDPPAIASVPRGMIAIGANYFYQVVATDPNGDPLSYSLATAPAGMTVDASGLVTWTPTPEQLGANLVEVVVADGRGGTALQGFSINVVTQMTNQPPTITSTPALAATVGREYAYDLAAVDPDGDPLQWLLLDAPVGMSVDPSQGTLRWTPTLDQIGSADVAVRVIDGQGGSSTQSFTIGVRSVNVPPGITSAPPTLASADELYSYAVRGEDADGDVLAFSLMSAPAGMTIDAQTGLIQWTPTLSQLGQHGG